MKIKFITCLYSDLAGTEFGGRHARGSHYRYSLLSLLKMSDADFLCYTSENELESLKEFFYAENNIQQEKIEFKVFDLKNSKFSRIINSIKNVEESKQSDRCYEIQYQKFSWWWDEDGSYDYYFWIDSGLSHSGLFPNQYLITDFGYLRGFFECTLFNKTFLANLCKLSEDKFFLISKENNINFWSGTVDPKWYTSYDNSRHIISGLFGGKKEFWNEVVNQFEHSLERIMTDSKKLYLEENILSLVYFNNKHLFNTKEFDVWWHEDNGIKVHDDFYKINKSFYKLILEINEL